MSALMCQNPEASTEKTLHECVEKPEAGSYRCGWDILWRHEAIEEVKGSGQRDHIPSDIVEARGTGSFKAMFGNGLVDIIDGIVRNFERVPICVDQRALFGGFSSRGNVCGVD